MVFASRIEFSAVFMTVSISSLVEGGGELLRRGVVSSELVELEAELLRFSGLSVVLIAVGRRRLKLGNLIPKGHLELPDLSS